MIELCIVVGTLGLLVFFGIARIQEMRRLNTKNPLQCQQNLKWIGQAISDFNVDHADKMPWELPMSEGGSAEAIPTTQATPHFKTLTNFLRNTRVLVCPMDPVRHRGTTLVTLDDSALSYFVNVSATTQAHTPVLAGDRTVSTTSDTTTGEVDVNGSTPTQWTHPIADAPGHAMPGSPEPTGNLLFGNGSLLETTTLQLQRVTRSFGTNMQRFILP